MSRIPNRVNEKEDWQSREKVEGVLPCPFCGLKPFFQAVEYKVSELSFSQRRYSFVCCLYMVSPLGLSKERAISVLKKNWNRRAYDRL